MTTKIELPPEPEKYKGYPVQHEAATFGGLQQVLTSTAKVLDDFHLEFDEPGGRCYVLIELLDEGEAYRVNRADDGTIESYTLIRQPKAVLVVQVDDDLARPVAAKQHERIRAAEALKGGGQQSLLEQDNGEPKGEGDKPAADSADGAAPDSAPPNDEPGAEDPDGFFVAGRSERQTPLLARLVALDDTARDDITRAMDEANVSHIGEPVLTDVQLNAWEGLIADAEKRAAGAPPPKTKRSRGRHLSSVPDAGPAPDDKARADQAWKDLMAGDTDTSWPPDGEAPAEAKAEPAPAADPFA